MFDMFILTFSSLAPWITTKCRPYLAKRQIEKLPVDLPIHIELPWAETSVSTGALEALDDPSVVKIERKI